MKIISAIELSAEIQAQMAMMSRQLSAQSAIIKSLSGKNKQLSISYSAAISAFETVLNNAHDPITVSALNSKNFDLRDEICIIEDSNDSLSEQLHDARKTIEAQNALLDDTEKSSLHYKKNNVELHFKMLGLTDRNLKMSKKIDSLHKTLGEVLKEKADLLNERKSGKPSWSNAPEKANYRAQDADGLWCWFTHEPRPSKEYYNWANVDGMFWQFPKLTKNKNWADTLEKRPF